MDYIISFFILAGAFFCFIAALGVIRLPDILCRMHAATKAGAFGASLLLTGAVLHFMDLRIAIQCALIVWFFYITAPIAAHLLGRIGYLMRPTTRPDYETVDEASEYYHTHGFLPLKKKQKADDDSSFDEQLKDD